LKAVQKAEVQNGSSCIKFSTKSGILQVSAERSSNKDMSGDKSLLVMILPAVELNDRMPAAASSPDSRLVAALTGGLQVCCFRSSKNRGCSHC
jgi:hypothetical protein